MERGKGWVRGGSIGKGSFGTVNLGVDKSDGTVFAVKSVERRCCLPTQLEALENEIRILRSLSSPFVVRYLADDEDDEPSRRNLLMEYLPAGTVAELVHRSVDDVDERNLRGYTWCIVSALRYVHSQGIVHCDVKGKNVLIGHEPCTAKLADFGSAVKVGDPIWSPAGSPLWMAPEVIRGEYQGPESDVWSMGCTVIEMITGKPAWEDRGPETLYRIACSGDVPEFPANLSELGRDFLQKCLARERSKRWSCDQLLRHPFISSYSSLNAISLSSPRCILDWPNSEFSDEEDDPINEFEISNPRARDRVGKLASSKGAIWESDGWMTVRGRMSEREQTPDAAVYGGGGNQKQEEETGTSSAYPDSFRTNVEISRKTDCNTCTDEGVSPYNDRDRGGTDDPGSSGNKNWTRRRTESEAVAVNLFHYYSTQLIRICLLLSLLLFFYTHIITSLLSIKLNLLKLFK